MGISASEAVLGCVLLRPELLDGALADVHPDLFAREEHRELAAAMLSLHARGATVDELALEDELSADMCERLGGAAGIGDLRKVPTTTEQSGHYLSKLKGSARARYMRRIGDRLVCLDPDAPPDLEALAEIQQELDHTIQLCGEWSDPIPLEGADPPPLFPVEALPSWLGKYVEALAAFAEVPPDLPGLLSLTALSGATRGCYDVEAPVGHREPATLYSAVVLPPGERKSAVVEALTRPIGRWEDAQREASASAVAEDRAERDVARKRLERLRGDAAKAEDPQTCDALIGEIAEITRRLDAPELRPVRILADDVTPEAAVGLLSEQGGRLAILSAEGGLFDALAGLYSDGRSNIDAFLKGHSGEPILVDRRSRDPERIRRATLTLGLAVQPEVLHQIASNQRFVGRGLLARFLWAVPSPMVGSRTCNGAPVPPAVEAAYDAEIKRILDSLPAEGPAVIRLSSAALEAWQRFRLELEPRLHPDTGDLAHLAGWAGKLPGQLARIAALFHVAEHPSGPQSAELSADTMRRALALAPYFVGHAQRALGGHADPAVRGAGRILRWIQEKGRRGFSKRDLQQSLKHGPLADASDRDAALALLVELGWLRQISYLPRMAGRPPSPRYLAHPFIFKVGPPSTVPIIPTIRRESNSGDFGDRRQGSDPEESPTTEWTLIEGGAP